MTKVDSLEKIVWSFREGRLFCEETPLSAIARRYGTPVYVYSYRYLIQRFREMDRAWRGRKHLVCFSLKSNSSLAVARALISRGAGVDVVSGGELERALRAGVSPEKIVFSGVGKTAPEIKAALTAGILFLTVESFPELRLINAVARDLRQLAPVALRVTPDVDPHTHRYITTGKAENKFGLDLSSTPDFYRQCQRLPNVTAVGIQMHIGSQILKTRPYVEGVKKLVFLIRELRNEGIKLRYLDIGGGMGVSYRGEKAPSPRDYREAISPLLKGLRLTLILEPGRFLTANAGCLLVRVIYLKKKEKKSFVIVDGAMNDLIRPSLYGAYHEIIPVRRKETPTLRADVVGPVCESGDFLGLSRRFPEPAPGDLLAVMSAGAYGYVMSSNYNSRPRAAEVMVSGARFQAVRSRETFRDLVRGERLPDFLTR